MVKTLTLTAEVTSQREVTFVLPGDIPTGWAEFIVVIAPLSFSELSSSIRPDGSVLTMREGKPIYFVSPHFTHPEDAQHFVATVEEIVSKA